jgi:hypothetical protein
MASAIIFPIEASPLAEIGAYLRNFR